MSQPTDTSSLRANEHLVDPVRSDRPRTPADRWHDGGRTDARGRPAPGATQSGPATNPGRPAGRSRFDALEVAFQIVAELRKVVSAIGSRDAELVRQIRQAGTSIPGNVAEGNRRTGRDRVYHFNVAAGSCDEARAAVRSADAWGLIDARQFRELFELVDRELAMLYRLANR